MTQTPHEALVEQLEDTSQAYTVVAGADTRLSQLQAAYLDAKATADSAAKQLKAITDAIKLELTLAAPDETRIELAAQGGAPGLRLAYSEAWNFDSKTLKVTDPETYVRYAKKSGRWTLSKVRAD